jgi:septal ring factor EnvC (AmiA/AmiB activator)
LIALSGARAAFRRRAVLLWMGCALVAISPSGCSNKKEQARQRAELTQALDQYNAQIGELRKQAAGLRARLDKVPEELQGLGTVRDDLHALEEGLGVEDGRGKWLSAQLDKAFASGKKEQIEAVSKAMPRGADGFAGSLVKVTHELMPFERLAEQRRFFEELDAAKAREARQDTGQDTRKATPPKIQ